jgi:hypothetical protein
MTECELQPDEYCPGCDPVPLFGVVPADDPHYLGGFVDERGTRHDPAKHEDGCPYRGGQLIYT